MVNLNPISFIEGTLTNIGNVFNEIWLWLLFNLITPIMIIGITALFFIGQYYLIKGYIWLFTNVFKKFYELYKTLFTEERKEKVKRFYTD